ncbi:uncharacterized protein K02A2.6-like [Wyeomyia smithii]|uniref:uncharacterized protein K02A2.6-like n=1 Tax=Wyeomyia smithii TaxID=174621 RepID=UPI002468195E|nr:uncharacterized protein K02A2.6-like [Wyeomyia smithii]
MDADIEGFVKKCRGCTLVSAPNVPEPMTRRDLPSGPWEDVALDYLGPLPEGQYLLVVIDYYSRFFEVCEMTSISAESTIAELTAIFCRFGFPLTLTADNAPQLSEECNEFSVFCRSHGIELINTIPYWPQINGEVERQNRTILKRLQIAQELGQDWRSELQKFLLTYRASSHSTTSRSPAELMFGHKIRTKLPHLPKFCANDEETRDRDRIQKEKGKKNSDRKRRARESDLQVGDRVLTKRMKRDNKLSTEFINEEFIIMTKQGSDVTIKSLWSGKKYRSNTAYLKKLECSNEDGTSENTMFPQAEEPAEPDYQEDAKREQQNGSPSANSEVVEQNRGRNRREPSWFQNFVPH